MKKLKYKAFPFLKKTKSFWLFSFLQFYGEILYSFNLVLGTFCSPSQLLNKVALNISKANVAFLSFENISYRTTFISPFNAHAVSRPEISTPLGAIFQPLSPVSIFLSLPYHAITQSLVVSVLSSQSSSDFSIECAKLHISNEAIFFSCWPMAWES